jgi:hypothetical protein
LKVEGWVRCCGRIDGVVGGGKSICPCESVWVGWGAEEDKGEVCKLSMETSWGGCALRRGGGCLESSTTAPVWVSRDSRRAGSRTERDAVLAASRAGRAALVEWDLLVVEHFRCVDAR